MLVQLGLPVRTAEVSPFTKPEKVNVKTGSWSPYSLLALAAVTVSTAGFTVRVALPLDALLFGSPAKLAVTPAGYDPALIPTRLADNEATPVGSVTAVPTAVPFTEKLTVLPARGPVGVVKVAESGALPP